MAGERMTSIEIWLRLYTQVHYVAMECWKRLHGCTSKNIDVSAVRDAGLSAKQAERFFAADEGELERSLVWLEQPGNHLLTATHPLYPPLLRAIPDYPGALFVKVTLKRLMPPSWRSWVAVRRHGMENDGENSVRTTFAKWFHNHQRTGLRYRRCCSQRRAVCKGRSVAVLGNGLFSIYPRRHQALAMRLIEADGAIVSEFPLSAQPRPANFPRRNRIISGLSQVYWSLKRQCEAARWSLHDARSIREGGFRLTRPDW